jgi:hypothetical protein
MKVVFFFHSDPWWSMPMFVDSGGSIIYVIGPCSRPDLQSFDKC